MSSPPSFADQDEALIAALAKLGNHEAFSELVRRRQSIVRATLRRYCGDAALADDLAQTAFLAAWRNIKKLKDPRKFAGWLKRIVLNTWLKELKKTKAIDAPPSPAAEAVADDPDSRIDLDRALASLSQRARLCVVLAHYDGLSHQAIADRTGIPLGTVKSDVRRGLIELKARLTDYATSDEGEND